MVSPRGFSGVEVLEERCLLSNGNGLGGGKPAPAPVSYYVSPSGNTTNSGTQSSPWPSVSYALGKVGGGHTIILEPGTYAPFCVTVGYAGTSASPTVIESQYKWQAVINGTLNPSVEGIATESSTAGTADYVTLNGFKVIDAGTFGVNLGGNDDILENCWVTGSTLTGVLSSGNNTSILNNLIEDNGTSTQLDHGLYASGSGLTVSGNIIRHNAGYGMQLYPNIQNSTISGNLVYGQLAEADIVISGASSTNTMTNNIILDDPDGGITFSGSNPISAWSGNQVDPTVSGASLDSISSNNLADYSAALSRILPPVPKTDLTPPSAAVFDSGFYFNGQTVWVRYTDNASLAVQEIGSTNLIITGPGGYSSAPLSIAHMFMENSQTLEVTYYLTPPAGGWTSSNSGTYSVCLQAHQVSDLAGNYAAAGTIGTFSMTIAAAAPAVTMAATVSTGSTTTATATTTTLNAGATSATVSPATVNSTPAARTATAASPDTTSCAAATGTTNTTQDPLASTDLLSTLAPLSLNMTSLR